MLALVIILRECEEGESFLSNEKKCNSETLAQDKDPKFEVFTADCHVSTTCNSKKKIN